MRVTSCAKVPLAIVRVVVSLRPLVGREAARSVLERLWPDHLATREAITTRRRRPRAGFRDVVAIAAIRGEDRYLEPILETDVAGLRRRAM
jgi:hypothetical protein